MSQSSGKVRKPKSRRKKDVELKRTVVRMLRVMEQTSTTPATTTTESGHDASSEFLVTGRTGRRNAMPDILGQNAQTTCSDLPDRMQSLCSVAPGTSGSDPSMTSSSPNNNSVSAS